LKKSLAGCTAQKTSLHLGHGRWRAKAQVKRSLFASLQTAGLLQKKKR